MTKISAVITAGGSSTRFGSNKLLEKIDNKTVIETTISKFSDLVDEIIIPIGEEVRNFLSPLNLNVEFVPAGSTRQKSVYNGLLACDNPDIVLIHDGARPFIEKETIKKIIELTFKNRAVVLGHYAVDTIKEVKNGKILRTLDRKNIFLAQTPQAFEYNLIKEAHCLYKNTPDSTDDSALVEALGVDVYVLEGSKSNIKITTKEDLS